MSDAVVLSAPSAELLRERAMRQREHAIDRSLVDVCHTLASAAVSAPFRRVFVGDGWDGIATDIEQWSAARPEPIAPTSSPGRHAFVFSGQGNQWPGMADELIASEPVFARALAKCDEAIAATTGWSVRAELSRTDSRLSHTEFAQPCVFAMQVALAELMASWGVEPEAVVGHSVGEIAAACVAGALTLEDAAALVARRGRVMAELHGTGQMIAIAVPFGEAAAVVSELGPGVDLAAINGPSSIVVSVAQAHVSSVLSALESRGQRFVVVNASYPFHGAPVAAVGPALAEAFASLSPRDTACTIASTSRGELVAGHGMGGAYWVANALNPVLFRDAVRALGDQGYRSFIEVGPHPALVRQVQACLGDARPQVVGTLRRGRGPRAELLRSMGSLFEGGHPIDWAQLYAHRGRSIDLPQLEAAGASAQPSAHPANHGQRTLRFLDRVAPGDPAYNVAFCSRVLGELDPGALRRAVTQVVARHDALRTAFRDEVDHRGVTRGLSVVVDPEARPIVEFFEPSDELEHRVLAFHRAAFDLNRGGLFRVGVFRRGEDDHVLLVTAHHAVADFRSLEIIMRDLESFYLGQTGQPAALVSPPRPSYESAGAEAGYVRSDAGKAARTYWAEALAGAPPPFQWPGPRSADDGARNYFFELGPQVTEAVETLARQTRSTAYIVLVVAWGALLSRHLRQPDLIVGAPVSTRDATFRDTVGYLVNSVPLRMRSDPARTFGELIGTARNTVLEALEHRAYPFHLAVEAAQAPRETGRNPLFQTMVVLQQPGAMRGLSDLYMVDAEVDVRVPWAGLQLGPWRMPQQEGQVDLALELVQGTDRFRCALKNRERHVPHRVVPQLARELGALLIEAAARPDAALGSLGELGRDERARLANTMNAEASLPDATDDLVQRVLTVARAQPDEVALVDGDTRVSYRELVQRAGATAAHLRAQGIVAGDRVGVCAAPSADAVVAMLAAMQVGGAYVPLDPTLPGRRLQAMIDLAGVRHVVLCGEATPALPTEVTVHPLARAQRHPAGDGADPPGPNAVAYTLFTSGSTGEPKGIDVRHCSAVAMLDATAVHVDAGGGDTWVWFHAASFDLSVWEIWGALCSGGRLVVVPAQTRSRPDAFVDLLSSERATVLLQTPSAMRMLVDELDRRASVDLSLRLMLSCGEALPGATARRIRQRGWPLWNMYGPAEATVYSTVQAVDAQAAALDVVPIGVGLGHVTVHVLDGQLRPLPSGVPGELYLGGQGVAVGYAGAPQKTAERFVHGPDGARLYRTGDIVVWDEHTLHFCGREDQQVKIRGFRVEIAEVEGALRSCAGVDDAAVVVEADAHGAELAALVIPRAGHDLDLSALRAELRQTLPSYMVPRSLLPVASLPVNAHDKLDRAAVRRMLEARPEPAAGTPRQATGDDTERALAQMWCRELRLTDVALDARFFEIGGTSLALMRVYEQVVQLPGGQRLRPTDLFRTPTIRELAALLRGGTHPPPATTQAPKRRRARDSKQRAARRVAYRKGQES